MEQANAVIEPGTDQQANYAEWENEGGPEQPAPQAEQPADATPAPAKTWEEKQAELIAAKEIEISEQRIAVADAAVSVEEAEEEKKSRQKQFDAEVSALRNLQQELRDLKAGNAPPMPAAPLFDDPSLRQTRPRLEWRTKEGSSEWVADSTTPKVDGTPLVFHIDNFGVKDSFNFDISMSDDELVPDDAQMVFDTLEEAQAACQKLDDDRYEQHQQAMNAEAPAPPDQPTEDDAWRQVTLAELGIDKKIIAKLEDAEITNFGQLEDFRNTAALIEIEGIGQAKAQAIEDAIVAYWVKHPRQ